MAKSLRSKRKRKMRAEKRIVNAKKELVKLREVAARLHGEQPVTRQSLESSLPDVQVVATPMSVDPDDSLTPSTAVQKRAKLQINNQWMNQRKIKSIKSKIKKHNVKKARRGSSANIKSRSSKRGQKR